MGFGLLALDFTCLIEIAETSCLQLLKYCFRVIVKELKISHHNVGLE